LLLAAMLASLTWSAIAADEIAVVNDNRVNVRGQASFNGEIITQLKKGEKVVILEAITVPKPKKGEPARWYRIALPANTPVWVNANFVKENVVSAPKLNVRSGPGENFSVIARLEKGAAIKEIRTVGDWKEIEAPATASAFVAADLLMRQETGDNVLLTNAEPEKPKPAPVVRPVEVETVKVEPTTPPVVANPEVTKPAPKRAPKPAPKPAEVASIPAPVTPPPAEPVVEAPKPVTPAATTAAAKAEPEKKPGFFSRVFGKSSKTNSTDTAKVAAEKKSTGKAAKARTEVAKAETKPAVVDTEPLPIRIVTREGVVRRSFNIQAPTDYALESTDSGKVINFLYTTNTNLPWGALKNRAVVVTGQEAIDKRWPNTPVLTIETLNTVP